MVLKAINSAGSNHNFLIDVSIVQYLGMSLIFDYPFHDWYSSKTKTRATAVLNVVVRVCYGAYFIAHVFKYLAPNSVSGRPE